MSESRQSFTRALAVAVLLPCLACQGAHAVTVDQLLGWWKAEPSHEGTSTTLFLQIKPGEAPRAAGDAPPAANAPAPDIARAEISVPVMGLWDVGCGPVLISGEKIDFADIPFPLEFDGASGTLKGVIPSDILPVYEVRVAFARCEAPAMPPAPTWDHPAPDIAWSHEAGAPVWAGLTHDDHRGRVIVANERGTISALDLATGQPAWSAETGSVVRAQPTIDGDRIYIADDSGQVHALNASDGTTIWRVLAWRAEAPRLEPTVQGTKFDRYAPAVMVDGDTLYVGGRDGALHALRAFDGSELWNAKSGGLITSTPVVWGDLAIFASFDGRVRAVARADGTERWSFDTKMPIAGDLVLHDDCVLAGSRSYELFALDAATGHERWRLYYWFSWIESPPCVVDGIAYLGSSDALLFRAVDVRDGSVRWERGLPGWSWSRPAVHGESVYVGATGMAGGNRRGALLAINRADGSIRWMLPADEHGTDAPGMQRGFASSPVVAGEFVLAVDLRGAVRAIKVP